MVISDGDKCSEEKQTTREMRHRQTELCVVSRDFSEEAIFDVRTE